MTSRIAHFKSVARDTPGWFGAAELSAKAIIDSSEACKHLLPI